jgi:hypothetical protein
MPIAQSPAHYINSSKCCPSITESFPLGFFLVLCATVAALPVVQPHYVSHLLTVFPCDVYARPWHPTVATPAHALAAAVADWRGGLGAGRTAAGVKVGGVNLRNGEREMM